MKKTEYRKEGYDISKTKDPMYYLDTKSRMYRPLDQQAYEDILNQKIRYWIYYSFLGSKNTLKKLRKI